MSWAVFDVFSHIGKLTERNDDDVFDRLSHRYTAAQFMLAVIIVSTSSLVSTPMHCWVPKHFTGAWTKYTNSYCWVRNTYYLPWDEEIPREPEDRRKFPIIYYQWVPLILMVQALCFFLPIVFWRGMNSKTGIDVNDIVETAEKVSAAEEQEKRAKIIYLLKQQMHRYLRNNKAPTKYGLCEGGCQVNMKHVMSRLCGKRKGNYITMLYVIIKMVFLANAIGQLWLTNLFLGSGQYQSFGVDVLYGMIRGEDWSESPMFPRVTLCDLDVRRLGNVHTYTVQCALTVNLFNEKIYLYLWFWMVFVAFATLVGFVMWVCRLFIFPDDLSYVHKYLNAYGASPNLSGEYEKLYDPSDDVDRKMLKRFVNDYLRMDGMLVVRLIDYNTDKMTMQDFLSALYEHWISLPNVHRDEMEMIEPA